MSISNRVEEILFLRKIETLGLKPMWDYIARSNGARGNGYHNTQHMFNVAKLAWKMWNVEVGSTEFANDTNFYSLTALLTACLWHDYDHSAGALPDNENILVAINAFEHWLSLPENEHFTSEVLVGPDPVAVVSALLIVTEFPFVNEPRFLAEKIIRDADLLYSFCDETGPVLYGLYTELSTAGRLPEDMTFLDMVTGQTKFHNEVQLFTETGLAIHSNLKAEVIREQLAYSRKFAALETS